MQLTKDLIVRASNEPLSIIIIGVGQEQFVMMRELDSDDQMLRASNGQVATRDLVQFVKFLNYPSRENLAEEVLKEVPDQLVDYMMLKKILPKPTNHINY